MGSFKIEGMDYQTLRAWTAKELAKKGMDQGCIDAAFERFEKTIQFKDEAIKALISSKKLEDLDYGDPLKTAERIRGFFDMQNTLFGTIIETLITSNFNLCIENAILARKSEVKN